MIIAGNRTSSLLPGPRRPSSSAEVEEARHLSAALERREILGQASGLLMARLDIGAEAAFEYLRCRSILENRRVIDIAKDIVQTRWNSPALGTHRAVVLTTLRAYPAGERPAVLVQLGGDWQSGELFRWSQGPDGELWADVSFTRPLDQKFLATFARQRVWEDRDDIAPGA